MTKALDVTRIWASAPPPEGGILDPGIAKYLSGWIAEIPSFQYINFMQYRTDTNLRALAERGFFEWSKDVQYQKNALAWDEEDSFVYINKTGTNGSLPPNQDEENWEVSSVSITKGQLQALADLLDAHKADLANPHKVTARQADTLTIVELRALIDENEDVLNAHIDIVSGNPHGTTALMVGAVPSTGGKYTGPVELTEVTNYGSATVDSTSGMFMKSGDSFLGLDEVGDPIANGEKIFHESQYLNKKLETEPDYSVPVPSFHVPLVSDIHIYQGVGSSTYSGVSGTSYLDKAGNVATTVAGVPAFGKYGMVFKDSSLVVTPEGNVGGWRQLTVSLKLWVAALPSENTSILSLGSSGYPKVVLTSGSELVFQASSDDSVTIGTIDTNKYVSFALSYGGTTLTTYLNGKQTSSGVVAVDPTDALTYITNATALIYFSSGKHWPFLLTPEQVSTL